MFQRPESWITNDVPLSTPGLDDTRLFMSLTAGAGTRTLLLSSLPSLTFMKEKESLNKVSFFYSLIFLSSCGCFIRKPIIVPVTGPLLWNSYYLPVDSFGKSLWMKDSGTIGEKLPLDAINPAHRSLLRLNSPSHGIFSLFLNNVLPVGYK